MPSARGVSGVAAAATLVLLGSAQAQQATSGPLDLDLRLGFIEHQLDDQRLHSQLWQYGWAAVNGTGLFLGSYQAATAGNGDDRVVGIVDATKSVIGLADLYFRPLPGLYGADPIRALPGETPEQQEERLAAAERLLKADAERAEERWGWTQHVGNLAVNLAGGAAILAFGSKSSALTDTLIGVAAGEVQILSAPWEPAHSLADYRSRFGGLAASMELRPRPGGLELAFRF